MPASWKEIDAIDRAGPKPPLANRSFLRMDPTVSMAVITRGSLNGISWATHWSYTSVPCWRSRTSSIQSVTGQPVASADSMPAHHGLTPDAATFSVTSISSDHVWGTLSPLSRKNFGEYQTNDFTFATSGVP